MNQTKRIEAYAIADFVKQIEDAVLDGFRLNLENNEKYPLQIGVGFYCTMDKVPFVSERDASINAGVLEAIGNATVKQYEQPSKPGRKPKV